MRLHTILLGLTLALTGSAFVARAADPIVIKFSHVVAPDTPKGKAAEKFRELAGRYTNGAVRVEVYPNSTLYKDSEELEALQRGEVQILAPSLAKLGRLGVREFEVFDLPYIFDGYEELDSVVDGPVGRRLLSRLESRGIYGLKFWDNGFKSFSSNVPIHTPADMKGLRMRIQSSSVLEEQMHALQAQPQAMDFSEVYQALKDGVVDGTENPHSNLYTQRMFEVQRYITVTNHGYLGYAVITNKAFWDGLPTAIRSELERAMATATTYANQIARGENDDALAAIQASGKTNVYVPTLEERAAFKRALVPVHKKMAARVGEDLIQAIYRATGFNPDNL
jgi:C4-dicarboxylate-binding protein DctP